MVETKKEYKLTLRLSPVTAYRLDRGYPLDGSRSKNEFVERAITRRLDQLELEENETLPAAVSSALNGRLDLLEKKLSSMAFRLAVTTDTLCNVLGSVCKLAPEELRRLRSKSVRNVRQTNGLIDLADTLQEEDPWQD